MDVGEDGGCGYREMGAGDHLSPGVLIQINITEMRRTRGKGEGLGESMETLGATEVCE